MKPATKGQDVIKELADRWQDKDFELFFATVLAQPTKRRYAGEPQGITYYPHHTWQEAIEQARDLACFYRTTLINICQDHTLLTAESWTPRNYEMPKEGHKELAIILSYNDAQLISQARIGVEQVTPWDDGAKGYLGVLHWNFGFHDQDFDNPSFVREPQFRRMLSTLFRHTVLLDRVVFDPIGICTDYALLGERGNIDRTKVDAEALNLIGITDPRPRVYCTNRTVR